MADLKNNLPIINQVAEVVLKGHDKNKAHKGSLTSVNKQNRIIARSFIDETVITENVLPSVTKLLHQWYVAQIFSALKLNAAISGGVKVQDVLGLIQTGEDTSPLATSAKIAASIFKGHNSHGFESFVSNYLGDAGLETLDNNTDKSNDADPKEVKKDSPDSHKPNDHSSVSVSDVHSIKTGDNRIGPMGELIEVTITDPQNKDNSFKVPVFVQIQPSIVSSEAAPRFIDFNVSPSLWKRWTQFRAGELSFFKEFLLNADLIKKQRSVIKDPKTADAFRTFIKSYASKSNYAFVEQANYQNDKASANLANSIMIFSEETVQRAKVESGVDLHFDRDRNIYFADSFTMAIVIIDPIHQRVVIYFNGIEGGMDLGYNELKQKEGKFDPEEFMQALSTFATGSLGRLR